ncbi:MAG TPA: FAD-dependent oxidoreductase, partial [Dehalococcoidia bacterium]|nr:FAD-dependent oxidoreductase [Dehalococcoidia bacterium]
MTERQPESPSRVAVVGGGIAGLTAAYSLAKRGFAVEVLEREAAAGGRMRSERQGSFVVERGAQFIASSYRNLHALASELGIASLVHPLRNTRNAVLKRGRFVASEYEGLNAIRRSRDLSWPRKLRLLRILIPLWRHRRLLDFYHPEKAAPLDSEDAASYVRRQFGREVLDHLVEPAFASTFTVLPENLSKAFLLSTVATMFRGFRLQAFRGGNGALTQALAARLPVRLNADVERVEATAQGVTIRLRDDAPVEADAAVVAVPGDSTAALCPLLTDAERRFFDTVRYASSIIVFVMAGAEAEPGFYGAGICRAEGVRLYGMAVENAKEGVVPPGKTMFNCAFSEELAAELAHASDEEVIAALQRELAKLPMRGLDTIAGYAVHR